MHQLTYIIDELIHNISPEVHIHVVWHNLNNNVLKYMTSDMMAFDDYTTSDMMVYDDYMTSDMMVYDDYVTIMMSRS